MLRPETLLPLSCLVCERWLRSDFPRGRAQGDLQYRDSLLVSAALHRRENAGWGHFSHQSHCSNSVSTVWSIMSPPTAARRSGARCRSSLCNS